MKKIFLILIALLMLTSCSSDKPNYYAGAQLAGGNFDFDSENYVTEEAKADYNYVDENSYDVETNSFDGKKIIYSANMSLESKNYESSKKSLEELIEKFNLSVTDKSERDYDEYWYTTSYHSNGVKGRVLNLTLRVPVEKFDEVINSLSAVSDVHVSSSSVSSTDNTKTYNDNATRIESLEVQEKRLIEILAEAENVSEILEVEDRLEQVRYQLKSLKDSNLYIDDRVKYSTITVTLTEVQKYSVEKYGFLERVKDTFGESWINFFDFLKDTVIFVISILPFVILFVAIILVINFIRKKNGKEIISLKSLKNLFKDFTIKKLLLLLGCILVIIILLRLIYEW